MDSDGGRTSINKIIYSLWWIVCCHVAILVLQSYRVELIGVCIIHLLFIYTAGYKSTLTQMVEEESCVYFLSSNTLFLLWQGAVYLLLNVHYPCVVQP